MVDWYGTISSPVILKIWEATTFGNSAEIMVNFVYLEIQGCSWVTFFGKYDAPNQILALLVCTTLREKEVIFFLSRKVFTPRSPLSSVIDITSGDLISLLNPQSSLGFRGHSDSAGALFGDTGTHCGAPRDDFNSPATAPRRAASADFRLSEG